MSNAQDFVTSFMKKLAGSDVTLTPALQNVFAKILANQVDVTDGTVTFKPSFANLSEIFTFIATPEADRPTNPLAYTDAQVDAAKTAAATETGLTVGGDAPVGPELPTDEPTEEPGVEGETFTLTTGVDVIEGTADADVLDGVVSAATANRTLNTTDQIDGGEGADTLNVDMQASFAGFTGEGKLVNVETVNLTNSDAVSRNFDASGVTGVEAYNLSGALSLTELADLNAAINLADRAAGTTNIAFQTDVTAGASTLNLGFENLGTSSAGLNVDVDTANNSIENLVATATGDNFVVLNDNGYETITTQGAGNLQLDVTAVATTQLSQVNAADQTGNLDLVADVAALTGAARLTGNAASDNTLTLQAAAAATTTYRMADIQNLKLEGAHTLTFSAVNVSGLDTVIAEDDFSGTATLNNLGNINLNVVLEGENDTATETLTVTNTAETAISVVADATATTSQENAIDVVANQAATVSLNVSEMSEFTGDVSATAATSLEVIADGFITGSTITLGTKAIDAVMTFNNTDKESALILAAADLQGLTVTTANDLDLKTSTLNALTTLTVATEGFFDGAVALAESQDVALSGAGQVALSTLDNTVAGAAITLTADGLTASEDVTSALVTGAITTTATAATNITLTDITGDVTIGAIDSRDTTINAAVSSGSLTVGAVNDVATNATRDVNITASVVSDDFANDVLTLGVIDGAALRDVTVDLTGTVIRDGNNFGTVTVGTIGGTSAARNVTIDVSDVQANVSTLAADATDNVTIDASGLVQDQLTGLTITVGATTASETATITGALASDNTIAVTVTDEATIVGGEKVNTIDVTGAAVATKVATFNIDLLDDSTKSDVDFLTAATGSVRGIIDNFVVGRDTLDVETTTAIVVNGDILINDQTTTPVGTDLTDARTDILAFLTSAGVTATATQITNVFEVNDGSNDIGYMFQFGGDTHVVVSKDSAGNFDDTFDDGDYFITLTGVTGLENLDTGSSVFA